MTSDTVCTNESCLLYLASIRLVGVLLSKCVWQAGACCYIVT